MMKRYVTFIVRHRVAVVIAVFIVTALFATQLRHLHLDIQRRAQLPQHHPYVQIQNAIADQFGGDTTMIVGVVAQEGDIFTPQILGKITRITHRLHDLPGVVRSNLLSIASDHVKGIRGTPDGLDVSPLLEDVPKTPLGMAEVKRRILADDIYGGVLVARDGTAAAIVADFDETLSDTDIYDDVEAVLQSERDATVAFPIGGAPVLRVYAARYTQAMAILFPIAVLVIAVVHYEAFRTLQAMFLPLVTALLSVTWALGIMGFLRLPMDTWSAITPVVILAVAAGHAVQILKRYYEDYATLRDNKRAVIHSLCAVGPVMLTAGTIASAGFGSLATFGVPSVRAFGFLLASGILSALVVEMTFVPACRAMLPAPHKLEARRERESYRLASAFDLLSTQVLTRPGRILGLVIVVLLCALYGATRLHVDNSLRAWFPNDSQLRLDDRLLNEHLAGTSTLYILLEGSKDGDLERPDVLQAIRDLQTWLERDPLVGATLSIADFVARMHQAMNGEQVFGGIIPDNQSLIAQYLFLYSLSGPDDFNSIVDPTHRTGLLRAYVKSDEANFARILFEQTERFTAVRFKDLPVKPRLAGGALGVQAALNQVIVREKILNVLQVASIIFILSSMVLRSVVGGMFVLAPLSVAVIISLGIMGLTGTWLSIATASITAMAVGIGADFAVYLIFRIREELGGGGQNVGRALRAALATSGEAIFFVSSAVVLGYLVLALSGFRVWIYLGTLTGLMVGLSALGTLVIIPALVVLVQPRFLWRLTDTFG